MIGNPHHFGAVLSAAPVNLGAQERAEGMGIVRGGEIGLEHFGWREVPAVWQDSPVFGANDDTDFVLAPTAITVLVWRPGSLRRAARPVRQIGAIPRAVARDDQKRGRIGRDSVSGLQGSFRPEQFCLQLVTFALQQPTDGGGAQRVAKDAGPLACGAVVVLRHRFQRMLDHARRELVRANVKACVEGERSPSSIRGSRGTRSSAARGRARSPACKACPEPASPAMLLHAVYRPATRLVTAPLPSRAPPRFQIRPIVGSSHRASGTRASRSPTLADCASI